MSLHNILLRCVTCNSTPKINEYREGNNLMAFYIECSGCTVEQPYKHVHEHGAEKARELCINTWNDYQRQLQRASKL